MSRQSGTESPEDSDPPKPPEVQAADIMARVSRQASRHMARIGFTNALATVLAASIAGAGGIVSTHLSIEAGQRIAELSRSAPPPANRVERGCVADAPPTHPGAPAPREFVQGRPAPGAGAGTAQTRPVG